MATVKDLQNRISPKFDEAVILGILKKASNCDSVTINKITIGDYSKKGDSYMSALTRFSIEATDSNGTQFVQNVIVKAYPKSLGRRKTFRSVDFFRSEVGFYEKVWPKLSAFQDSKNVKENFDNIPNVLACYHDENDGFIAMEDLCFQDFRSAPRDEALDLAHLEILMRLFARFHALSYAFKEQHPKEFDAMADVLQETYFSERLRAWNGKYYKNLQAVVIDAVEKQLEPLYLEKIKAEYEKDIYGEMVKLCQERNSPFAVVTHADPWIPNFLMQYSETGTLTYVKMIDFQLSRCSSLSLDLLFFLYTCTDQPLRLAHFDHLLAHYHRHFTAFATELGASSVNDRFTLAALIQDMRHCAPYGLGICTEANVMSLLDDDEVFDVNAMVGEEAIPVDELFAVGPFKHEAKRQRVAEFVKHMVDYGFI